MRLVVADTSPLNYLVLIEQVAILPALFEKVFVPQIVRDELRHDEAPESVRRWIAEPPSWVEIVPAGRDSDDPALVDLDDGERAAIQLAVRIRAELLLIDDRDGVNVARCNCVIALPPSGLMGGYWKVVNKAQDAAIVVLKDTPENILKRITFYDIDSRPIQRNLTDREKRLHLRKIKGDITYFSHSFQRAHVSVDITGGGPDEAARKVKDRLTLAPSKERSQASDHPLGRMR